MAERLRTVVRPTDTVARLGGDEFALLLEELASADEELASADEELASADEALAVVERAIDAVAAPFELAVLRPRDLTNKESPERGRIGPDGCRKLRPAGIQAPI